jgi:glucosamine-6-phosphate deaminase
VTASCPASVLQLHPHVTMVVDEAAAARLHNADLLPVRDECHGNVLIVGDFRA